MNAEGTKVLFLRQSVQSNIISLNYVDNLFGIGVMNYKELYLWFQMRHCLKEELT